MAYKVIDKTNTIIGENLTLGEAFTCLDDWCRNNDGKYGLGNIYHEYDNQICITVYTKNNSIKLFSIVYE